MTAADKNSVVVTLGDTQRDAHAELDAELLTGTGLFTGLFVPVLENPSSKEGGPGFSKRGCPISATTTAGGKGTGTTYGNDYTREKVVLKMGLIKMGGYKRC